MEFGLKEMPAVSRVQKNPFYEDILKNGFSIAVHYSPEDVAEIINGKQKFDFDLLEHDPDELAAFEKYRQANNGENHGQI
ncbi:MAG: hypothetical protein FWG87_00445 [Defluviitaleaceae bacterium]|nr:hypothetical protein [Defluviitaleaceae bacterium]